MNYLFYVGHPAHYHNFKFCAKNLMDKGHKILFAVREKDVLLDLIKDSGFNYQIVSGDKKRNNIVSLVLFVFKRELTLLKLCLSFKPDILIGTDIVITHVGKLLGKPSVVVNEDDDFIVPKVSKYGYRFADAILAPDVCAVTKYHDKKVEYKGYHELAYLHPNYFTPDSNKIKDKIDTSKPFFILRFAKLNAHHDVGRTGITDQVAQQIIDLLKPYGNVYITSERELNPEFEPYRISIHPKDIHHALALATLYIGDSQTMAAEAAVLGTYALRYNDFAGEIGYLNDLDNYNLSKSFKTSQYDELIQEIKHVIEHRFNFHKLEAKRAKMLSEKIDVTSFWTDYFINYLRK